MFAVNFSPAPPQLANRSLHRSHQFMCTWNVCTRAATYNATNKTQKHIKSPNSPQM